MKKLITLLCAIGAIASISNIHASQEGSDTWFGSLENFLTFGYADRSKENGDTWGQSVGNVATLGQVNRSKRKKASNKQALKSSRKSYKRNKSTNRRKKDSAHANVQIHQQ